MHQKTRRRKSYMKKKLLIKRLGRKQKEEKEAPSRITNETVAEHRERILAGGRKFKYPVQYARHRLVINAILVTLAALVLLAVIGWWQLYLVQNSSAFMYRITRILPVPVASVDGEYVPYRDYLVQYRGSEYYLSKYGEVKKLNRLLMRGSLRVSIIFQCLMPILITLLTKREIPPTVVFRKIPTTLL